MHGHLSQDTQVAVPAAVIWDVYGTLELGRLVNKLLGDVIGSVEVIEGDGGVGTLIKVTFRPGSPVDGYMIEKFTKVDDENRVKETEIVEGGYKALGRRKMRGHLSQDTAVEVPAAVIWDVYRGLQLGKLADELLGDVVGKVEVVQGDGGVGTIVKVTFPPGTPGPGYMKERITIIDDEIRLKEAETIEGGFKDVGFDVYRMRLQILEKDAESSIVRSSVDYEIDDKLQELASQATTKPMEILAEVVGKYLKEKLNSTK
ncbi:MLP-like protein 423, putative [Theobroma cacao]|uniref:MLP-like protein 423, putative n=1 Tax=Theobroma cacao TaxID=3641 RepID=A0A061EZA0_THECC|nr:MLP-like protein 423, putative [Theobroma cacao]